MKAGWLVHEKRREGDLFRLERLQLGVDISGQTTACLVASFPRHTFVRWRIDPAGSESQARCGHLFHLQYAELVPFATAAGIGKGRFGLPGPFFAF